MKKIIVLLFSGVVCITAPAQTDSMPAIDQQEINKEIARNFYQDLWFTNNTDKYVDYLADQYVVHDIGGRKNVTEPAIEQKNIADMFWENGELSGYIDYQIAEGDLVATRWHARLEPETLLGHLYEMDDLPIINVFRFENGKIVEIWNHRHDIDTNRPKMYLFLGLLIGLIIALIPTIIAFRLKRKLKARN